MDPPPVTPVTKIIKLNFHSAFRKEGIYVETKLIKIPCRGSKTSLCHVTIWCPQFLTKKLNKKSPSRVYSFKRS